jgi:hypothetical protein
MRILEVDPNLKDADIIYNAFDNIFYFLAEYLPKYFLHSIDYNGEILQIPKYITQKHYDSLDTETKELFNELWDLVEINKY